MAGPIDHLSGLGPTPRRAAVTSSAKQALSDALKIQAPQFWQFLKYRQYLLGPRCEPEIRIVRDFVDPQRLALDIGVHLGFYTRRLAKYAKVVGFEANPRSAAFAQRSLARLAEIEWAALSSEHGTATLRVPRNGTAGGPEAAMGTLSSANALEGLPCEEIAVPSRRLDDFMLAPVGFMKIDVEGHEEAVLEGGEGILRRDHPNYLIEVEERHNPGSVGRVLAYFQGYGYTALYYERGRLWELAEADPALQADPARRYIYNFFFVPKDWARQFRPARVQSVALSRAGADSSAQTSRARQLKSASGEELAVIGHVPEWSLAG